MRTFPFFIIFLFSLLSSPFLAATPRDVESDEIVDTAVVEPTISLITCERGDELYSAYGHSALRLYYPSTGEDFIFNFGLFDFSTPNFYWKFIRGRLQYLLGVQYRDNFVYQYRYEEREVKEQLLNLNEKQREELIGKLHYRYLPENRAYLYSFLYKNCTSELRDLLFPLLSEEEVAHFYDALSPYTFREHLNFYTEGWVRFGINLILGSTIDREVSLYEAMFLPDNLYDGVEEMVNGGEPIVVGREVLYSPPVKESEGRGVLATLLSPFSIALLLLILTALSVVGSHFKGWRCSSFFREFLIAGFGATGLFLLFIILITEHQELYANYNLLWCNPLFALVTLSTLMGWKKMERTFSALSIVSLALLHLFWSLKVQFYEPSFIVISLMLLVIFVYKALFSSNFKVGAKGATQ